MATNNQLTLDRQWSAQGTITIQRLRQGDLLSVTLANLSGKPLYQTYDADTKTFLPNWSGDNNDAVRPVIAPQVVSMLGAQIVVNNPTWHYNGLPIAFTTPTNPLDWAAEDSASPRFAYRPQDMAIKPIDNIANPNNPVNGVLKFTATVLANGGAYEVSKEIDMVFAPASDSAYRGFLTATNLTLDEQNTSTVITATLFSKGVEIATFFPRWRRDRDAMAAMDGRKEITVTRGMVDSTQLYICEFYLSQTDTQPVAVAGVTVVDAADNFDIIFEIISENKCISDTNPSVTVQAHLISEKTGGFITSGVRWLMDVIDKDTCKSLKSSDTDTITVTTAETDRMKTVNGKSVLICSDVDVMAEAHWGLNFSIDPTKLQITEPYYRDANYVKGEAIMKQV